MIHLLLSKNYQIDCFVFEHFHFLPFLLFIFQYVVQPNLNLSLQDLFLKNLVCFVHLQHVNLTVFDILFLKYSRFNCWQLSSIQCYYNLERWYCHQYSLTCFMISRFCFSIRSFYLDSPRYSNKDGLSSMYLKLILATLNQELLIKLYYCRAVWQHCLIWYYFSLPSSEFAWLLCYEHYWHEFLGLFKHFV